MKRISLISLAALALALLVSTYGQTPQSGAVKKVQVTAQTLARHSAGTPYAIDLTRRGTVYEVAEGVDQSRMRVRTSTGEKSLSELMRKSGTTITGNLLMGTIDDLSSVNFGFPPDGGTVQPPRGVTEVKCALGVCKCVAGTDCKDMAKSKLCDSAFMTSCCKTCGTNGKRGCMCVQAE